jgi:hypothetical protein
MQQIEKRNNEIEKNRAWIDWAYSGLAVRSLNDLPPGSYRDYAGFVENRSVYIFVHPAYYPFFHSKRPGNIRTADNFSDSIADVFLKQTFADPVMRIEQEQLRNEKNFIEYLSTDNKLVILILPRNYSKADNYKYNSGQDEFARYLNGIANGSRSILYIESETSSSGRLLTEDLIVLLSFFEALGIDSVMIGGGYVGRCQKEFYNYISGYTLGGQYYLVPELSTFSPDDITEKAAKKFLAGERIDIQSSSEYVLARTPGNTNIQHLSRLLLDNVLNISQQTEGQEQAAGNLKRNEGSGTSAQGHTVNAAEEYINYCY